MAILSPWVPHVDAFVNTSLSSKEQNASLDAIASLVKSDRLSIEALVKEMGLYLTTTDHAIRGRGILLLAELLTSIAQKPLDSATIHSLMAFFTEKLADWQALHGTLIGCLALLRRKSSVGMVTGSDALACACSFLVNVRVQSLGKDGRKLSFEILVCLMDRYPDTMADLGDDLIYGVCAAIDAEMDPECLMLAFHLVADLGLIFPDPFGPLEGFAEELFEVLGRYFPVHFTHPNESLDIKRDDLSRELMLAFSSTPLFEPFAIPLLLDKLSSSLPPAKVDSLKYLRNCSMKYGADIMAKHAKGIWSSLRETIFTSTVAELPMDPGLQQGVGLQENEILKESLMCMQKFMLQDDGLFLGLILEDEEIELVFKSVTSVKSHIDFSAVNKQKLRALGCILSASTEVSSVCCNKVFESFFPRLMGILGLSLENLAETCRLDEKVIFVEKLNFGALYLCLELLVACRSLVIGFDELSLRSISVKESWCGLLEKFSSKFSGALHCILDSSKDSNFCDADICCGVKGLQILATFPGHFVPISKSIFEKILTVFVSIMTGGCGKTLLGKLTLKALVEIGTFLDKFHDSEKVLSFMTIVVENIVQLIPLQLEAILDIGATGPKFMLKVTEGLEEALLANFSDAYVKGGSKSVDTLIALLKCYSSKVFPWFHRSGDFESVALHFSVTIWNQVESNIRSNIRLQEKELLNEMLRTMKLAVAGCSENSQGLIVQKAYNVLLLSTTFKEFIPSSLPTKMEELQLDTLSHGDERLISLFSSVVIALRPQTPLPDVRVILHLFIIMHLKGYVPAAQALGSMVNKLPLKMNSVEVPDSCTLEDATEIILKMDVSFNGSLRKFKYAYDTDGDLINSSLTVGKSKSVQSNAIVGLAWVGKGLVMRGHEKVRDVIMIILRCLLSSSKMKTPQLQHEMSEECRELDSDDLDARSAADAFHIVLGDSDDCLNLCFHANIRPLYKQRFFSSMMPILLSSIKECDSSTTRSMLYRAFGHVIYNTPLLAVVTDAKRLIYVLLDGLSVLSEHVHDKDLTYNLLAVLSEILMDDNGREIVTDNAHIILKCLIGLVSYRHMMVCRETAIQCLVAMSELPHTRIYPIRTQVLQVTSKALDDPKRTVRLEAARCRHAWMSIA